MVVSVDGKLALDRLVQPDSMPRLIAVRPLGKSIEVNDVQFSKTKVPISAIPVGNSTPDRAQFAKALEPMTRTGSPSIVAGITAIPVAVAS